MPHSIQNGPRAVEHADAVAELDPELDEVALELLRQAEGFLFEFDALV